MDPAFLAATELEFRENLEELEFEPEHNLSKEPLRMDLLILKKNGKKKLSNEIGHMMRERNIIEYKGPGDALTIDTLYKVIGYASLYKGYGKYVDEIKAEEITISIFRWSYPDKLMSQLKEKGYRIEQNNPGIYYISGNTSETLLFPVQIVIIKQLRRENHSSLRILTKKADIKDVKQFLEEAEILQGKRDRENIDAVLQVSVRANEAIYEKVRSERHMCEALKELMKDEFEKERLIAITEGRAEGHAKGMAEGRIEGRRQGAYDALIRLVIAKIKKKKTVEETADMLEESPETIQKIYDLAEKMAPDYDAEKILEQLEPDLK